MHRWFPQFAKVRRAVQMMVGADRRMVSSPLTLGWLAPRHEQVMLKDNMAASSEAGFFKVDDSRNAIAKAERVLAAPAA